jgi:uncharacterized protein Yka (UPF0111/DUF47 family)
MLGWFRALMPKEERFFELFTRHAQVTLSGAETLRALLSGSGDVVRCCNEVNAREEEADAITRDVLIALRRSFITPLDRGDIKDLITSMDDAIDQMNKTAKVIRLFEFRNFAPRMLEMGELVVRAALSFPPGCFRHIMRWRGPRSSTSSLSCSSGSMSRKQLGLALSRLMWSTTSSSSARSWAQSCGT